MAQVLPQWLRNKISRHSFWLEKCADASFLQCVGLAADLQVIEGFVGQAEAVQPTPMVCVLHRMLQLRPTPELLDEMIRQTSLKYLRFVAILLVRVSIEDPVVVHAAIDVGLADFRTVRLRDADGLVSLVPFDVAVERLLTDSTFFGVPLPALLSRANTAAVTGELMTWPAVDS